MSPAPFVKTIALAVAVVGLLLLDVRRTLADEEFVGPFPSWRDLKRDYGAVGDGRSDDTKALQKAARRPHQARESLRALPAGRHVPLDRHGQDRPQSAHRLPGRHPDRRGPCAGGAALGRTQGWRHGPVGRLVFQNLPAHPRRCRQGRHGAALRSSFFHIQRDERYPLPEPREWTCLRRPEIPGPGRERGAALPLRPLWRRAADGRVELDGHLGLVLPIYELRPRRPQRHGQLARLAELVPAFQNLRCQHPEPDGLLGGQQHQHRPRSASSTSAPAIPWGSPTSITGNLESSTRPATGRPCSPTLAPTWSWTMSFGCRPKPERCA